MSDIANLGFAVDTGGLQEGKAALEALAPAAIKAETATDRLEKQFTATGNAADRAATGVRNNTGAVGAAVTGSKALVTLQTELMRGMTGTASASTTASAAIQGTATAANEASGALGQLDAHVKAYRASVMQASTGTDQFNAHVTAFHANMGRTKDGIGEAGKQLIKFGGQDSLNAMRQLSDIGVTAAMGMSPFMIAIQQGPQLLDILQNKAAMTGQTLGAVFKAAAAQIWAAMLPLLPIILGIAAAVGAVAAAFGIATREINKGNDDVIKGLGLTDDQLKKVKKSGVDTGVTISDTFFGFFDVVGERLTSAFAGPLKWLSDAWNATIDFIVKYVTIGIKGIIGAFTGAFYAVKAVWGMLPGAIGDVVIMAANKVISSITWMVNKAIAGINWLADQANSILPDALQIGKIGDVSLGQLDNPFAGQAAAAGKVAGEAYAEGFGIGSKSVTKFFSDVAEAAGKRRNARIMKAAGDPGAGSKDASKGGKTDGEKFSDIVGGAERDIAETRAKIEGVNLSADAARRLTNEQKLLNEASQKGIKLTPQMREQLQALAGTLSDLQTQLANLQGFKEINADAQKSLAALVAEGKQIDLVGQALATARYEQDLFNQAVAKGVDVTGDYGTKLQLLAVQLGAQSAKNDHDSFITGATRDADERMRALREEQSYIGKSADVVARLRIENELLAQARQKNIDLTPADIAAIHGIATEQAETEKALRKTQERLEFARDTAKGFLTDLTSGLREGKTLWESFADAAVNALNKIIDKMLDQLFNKGIDALMNLIGGLGGGLGGGDVAGMKSIFSIFKGGFADGGVFTNGIITSPTMFAFAKGGALGLMGEAGPEAIMPLQRGSDGSLGVQMYGGGARGGMTVHAPVTVNNYTTLTGALSSADIVAMQRKAAEDTKNEVKRSLMSWIDQFQRDGALV